MTLKLKLIGMTGGMVLFLAFINFLQFERVLNSQRTAAIGQVENYSATLGFTLASKFKEKYYSPQNLALLESLRTEKTSEASVAATFDEYVRLHPDNDLVLFVDVDGNYLASNQHGPDGKKVGVERLKARNYSDSAWFKNTMAGRFSEEPQKGLSGTFVEDAQVDPITTAAYGNPRYVTPFTTLVKNTRGNTVGVLTTRVSFSWVENEIKDFYLRLKDSRLPSAAITLVNANGLTLASYFPMGNNGDLGIERDLDQVILKQNLSSSFAPVTEVLAGKSGSMSAFHPIKKQNRAVGFTSLRAKTSFPSNLGWGVLVSIDEDQACSAVAQARSEFIWICAGVMCLFVLLAYWFSVSISRSLGVLSVNISETSFQVINGSDQMASASQSLASTATEAASSLEETVTSIEQLSAMVKRNADHAMEAATLSEKSRRSADDGESEIKKLVSAMEEIHKSSNKIEDIINVIEDIAFQTNLLALNAAVEAARAGDQGKGFAVVAEEVRNLAQRSGAAAKDITTLIKENVSKIKMGVDIAGEGGSALKHIVTSVRKVADLNGEIAAGSKEQSLGLDQISQAMAQLDQVTQTNAASAEEVASSAEEMASQGLLMKETVGELNRLIHGFRRIAKMESASPKEQPPTVDKKYARTRKVIPMRTRVAENHLSEMAHPRKAKLGSTAGF